MIDQVLILSFVLLVIVAVSLQGVLFTVPIFQKMAFDAVCHRGLMQMDQSGGMTDEIQLFLENRLAQEGFTVISIHGDQTVDFGSEMTLYVEAMLPVQSVTPYLEMSRENRAFTYHNSILSRHLITSAGLP